VSIPEGTHELGPDNARLTVHTRKAGAAAVAGHNLLIEVGGWSAALTVGPNPSLKLTADSRSFKVLDGTGGIQSLGEDDMANISQTINDEVLKGGVIEFTSGTVRDSGDRLHIDGELNLLGKTRPLAFDVAVSDDGVLTGEATFKQTDWGMKPYSALFGTLKVGDELKVAVDGRLPAS
jgi:hypothetical protein